MTASHVATADSLAPQALAGALGLGLSIEFLGRTAFAAATARPRPASWSW